MNIQPVRTPQDYENALRRISDLMDADPTEGTDEFDLLDILVTLVEAYERKHYPIAQAPPADVIQFHMERLGLTQAELARQAKLQPTHLSAVLKGHRQLSLNQIRKLSAFFEIPAGSLIDNPFRDDSEHRPSAG
ncbi:helix-turn-helix domain-containing protein [Lujinxingia vulgaris]|uniref:Helix-turn-helix domain-containing protein n=1 Tax=Lujinxingia vulgaris TaxID=2600176 RepID=A0A5C6XNL9_9DELT|nr:helix-turn-helix domain-containing protein [Lujinxingia vulgaris]TXD39212.1 helix-turn-helix domain-containing protein [Lujinxingia vulgaris]